MPNKITYTKAIGRRKEAVARVRLTEGAGLTTVNGKPINEYFAGSLLEKAYLKPFEITNTLGKYTVSILVSGGGFASQLGASVHGISRALNIIDADKYRPTLKSAGLLTRDPRAKERRKYGNAQKARAKKQSPKR
jgi:small subunit ribosomal protein S9